MSDDGLTDEQRAFYRRLANETPEERERRLWGGPWMTHAFVCERVDRGAGEGPVSYLNVVNSLRAIEPPGVELCLVLGWYPGVAEGAKRLDVYEATPQQQPKLLHREVLEYPKNIPLVGRELPIFVSHETVGLVTYRVRFGNRPATIVPLLVNASLISDDDLRSIGIDLDDFPRSDHDASE